MRNEDRVVRNGNRYIAYGNNRKVVGSYPTYAMAISAVVSHNVEEQKIIQDKFKSSVVEEIEVCQKNSPKKKKDS